MRPIPEDFRDLKRSHDHYCFFTNGTYGRDYVFELL